MITHFDNSRWPGVINAYEDWWTDKLDRPLFNIQIYGAEPDIEKPEGEILPALFYYDFDIPADVIIKHAEYSLCSRKYLCDAYPSYLPDFGAGVNAGFQGAAFSVGAGTVWYGPDGANDMETFHIAHRPESALYQKIMEIYEKADAYFGGDIVLGMTHLNNGIDIPARFFGADEFCTALYDKPEHVERLVWENHSNFIRYVDMISAAMKRNRGFTCSGGILALEPWMGLQSDFSVMINTNLFKRFVLPELAECCRVFPKYNFYHIDGREQLHHLDTLLEIPQLQVLQFQRGVDRRPEREWMHVFKKIRDAGKKIWYTGTEEGMNSLADALGSLRGVYWQTDYDIRDEDEAHKAVESFVKS